MNDNFQNEKNNNKMKKIYYIFSVIVLLVMCFTLIYLITDRLTNPKYDQSNIEEREDKIVYNSTDKLDENTTIEFMIGNEVAKELSLKEFKNENNIDVDVTQEFLFNYVEASGYKLEALGNNKIVFKKENEEVVLIPNKYYLGEKDGYFAIYKTDSEGKAFIESENDVFKDSAKVDTIPVEAEENIKSLKYYYDTKEEALQRIAGYMN